MPEKISPFNSTSYGWSYGEDNWNVGMDSNLKKFSYLLDRNIDGIVASLPTAVNGKAYFNTSDNRLYYALEGVWESLVLPKWFVVTLRTTGENYTYDGTELIPYDVLSVLAESTGTSLIGYKGDQTLEEVLEVVTSVKDFGAVGDNAVDDTVAFQAAVDYLNSVGGGILYIPRGIYRLTNTINIVKVTGQNWYNLKIKGDGTGISVLDFATAAAGSDGIGFFGWSGRFTLQDLEVRNSRNIGININKGITVGSSTSWISRFSIRNVVVDGSLLHGIQMRQTYMATFSDVEVRNSGQHGFNFEGFHTSLHCTRCWAGGDQLYPNGGNQNIGWALNGITYSSFVNCAADWNGGPGYRVRNVAGVDFTSCGSESNGKEGYLVQTTNDGTTGIPGITVNIKGLLFEGCFGLNNSKEGASLYANLIGVSTANSRPATLMITNCVDESTIGATYSLVANGSSGTLNLTEQNNQLIASRIKSGSVIWQNNSVAGKSCMVRISEAGGAHQNISNNIETTLNAGYIASNTLGATLVSGGIVIPTGVNRVRVTGGAFFGDNSVGHRMIRVLKDGNNFVGSPQPETKATGFTGLGVCTAVVDVVPGEAFYLRCYQDSGGVLTVQDSPSTFLSVEAVG